MDYEFTRDEYGKVFAQFSMGHEAIGRWFSQELGTDQAALVELLERIDALEQRKIGQHRIEGDEYQLRLNWDQIEVLAMALEIDVDEELPESTNLYDQELFSECGLQDFKQAVLRWQEFIISNRSRR